MGRPVRCCFSKYKKMLTLTRVVTPSTKGWTRGSVLWGRMGGKAKPTKHTAKELAKKVCRSYTAPFSSNLHCVSRFAVLAGAQTPLVPMQDLTEWNGSGL